MLYIFAIGNPGPKYEKTRHNAGKIAGRFLLNYNIQDKNIGTVEYKYIETDTFMNLSGNFIKKYLKSHNYHKSKDYVAVIYDDKDIELGDIKNGYNRGAGGHNGIKNIIDNIGKDFYRIRVGISDNRKRGLLSYFNKDKQDIADYVLERLKSSELKVLQGEEMKNKITQSVILIYKEIASKAVTIRE
ncbi:MAG: aminoacyl-tRNA hydrolase [Cyanobium sp. MAG06]|nr:aminoacyl-tRNA hydrolase [Cyanobium sp. MAG06]